MCRLILILIALIISGCEAYPKMNIAPNGTYHEYIEWDIQSIDWGYPSAAPVNYCAIHA